MQAWWALPSSFLLCALQGPEPWNSVCFCLAAQKRSCGGLAGLEGGAVSCISLLDLGMGQCWSGNILPGALKGHHVAPQRSGGGAPIMAADPWIFAACSCPAFRPIHPHCMAEPGKGPEPGVTTVSLGGGRGPFNLGLGFPAAFLS